MHTLACTGNLSLQFCPLLMWYCQDTRWPALVMINHLGRRIQPYTQCSCPQTWRPPCPQACRCPPRMLYTQHFQRPPCTSRTDKQHIRCPEARSPAGIGSLAHCHCPPRMQSLTGTHCMCSTLSPLLTVSRFQLDTACTPTNLLWACMSRLYRTCRDHRHSH